MTLQATALVNEAYLRLVDVKGAGWNDQTHFFALSAQVMRRILVDAARARACAKRGGGAAGRSLDGDRFGRDSTRGPEQWTGTDCARWCARRGQRLIPEKPV